MFYRMCLVFLGMMGCSMVLFADDALLKRADAQQFIKAMVREHQFDRKQLQYILKEAKFQPQIIESMEKPYEKKTWDQYKALFLTPQRVAAGVDFWRQNRQVLARTEEQYGVPASMIVAIVGVETLYGKNQGHYRVLDALTTLAFYYPKRSAFFTKELKEYLLLCRENHVSATYYLGSYAGAIGKPQFMPSSYRFYAVDYSGNGHTDLMHEDQDVIASVANYFHQHGWHMHDAVVQPLSFNSRQISSLQTNTKNPNYTYKHLVHMGLKSTEPVVHGVDKVGVIELMTPKGQEYWLAHPNFYVITRYNTSPQYALVVYLLAQELRQHYHATT